MGLFWFRESKIFLDNPRIQTHFEEFEYRILLCLVPQRTAAILRELFASIPSSWPRFTALSKKTRSFRPNGHIYLTRLPSGQILQKYRTVPAKAFSFFFRLTQGSERRFQANHFRTWKHLIRKPSVDEFDIQFFAANTDSEIGFLSNKKEIQDSRIHGLV